LSRPDSVFIILANRQRSITGHIHLMSTALSVARSLRTLLADHSYRRVLALALPAVGEQLLNMAVGLFDTFMVGHIGAEAVAAVGLANQAVMLVTTFYAAVATGVTALVARHIGAGEPDQANRILHQGYLLGTGIGLLGSISVLALALPIMAALRAPAEVMGPGAGYLRITAATYLLAAWLFVGSAALRGAGDTRSPMLVMLVVNIINIVVAYLFIYGPGPFPALGVAGSAIGAATGRGVGGLLVTWLLWRGRGGLRLQLRRFLPDLGQIKRILNIGVPAGAEQLMMRLGMTAYITTVAALGTKAYAAHQLALQGESLAYMPGFGFAVAATTLVGQGLGARDLARARSDGYLAQRLAVILMAGMGVLFFTFPAQIIGVFIDDPEVIQLGIWPLRLVAFSQPALATMMVLAGGLRGAGDTRATLVITAAGLWLVRLPLALLLTGPLGLLGAWIAMGVDLNLRGLGMWLRFRSGRWAEIVV
jgi:MATE family multidrug resistance protein